MGAHRISAVLCSGDLARSQEFYERVVGLRLSAETIPNHLLFECGDGHTAGQVWTSGANQADQTRCGCGPQDPERDVRELESRGAVFEEYDFPTLKTVDHIARPPASQVSLVQRSRREHAALFQPE